MKGVLNKVASFIKNNYIFILFRVICLLVILSSAIILKSNPNYKYISTYSAPTCDMHNLLFEEGICPECSTDKGVLISYSDTSVRLNMFDYYDSCDDYQKQRSSIEIWTWIVLGSFTVYCASSVIYFMIKIN